MADIPLKSEEDTATDFVGAIEDIAQSVKAGSRDFTKSFNGLTTAIKRLQTTLVNAIKSIKVQIVTKPEKAVKQTTKAKETSTKEVTKEKEKVIEKNPEVKVRAKKSEVKKEPVASPVEIKVESQPKTPLKEEKKEESDKEKNTEKKKLADAEALILKALAGDFKTFWKKLREFSAKVKDNDVVSKALKNLIDQGKIKKDPNKSAVYSLAEKTEEIKPKPKVSKAKPKIAKIEVPKIETPEVKPSKLKTKKEVAPPNVNESKVKETKVKEKPPKVIDPAEVARKEKKNKIADESAEALLQTRKNNAQLSALRLQKTLLPKPEKKAPEPKETREEKQVRSVGKPGTKNFVGPRLEEESLANEKARKRRESAEKEEANAEKTLRTYFREKEKNQEEESSRSEEDFIKQQQQAARQLEQANQRTQKELDSMIAGFQNFSPLFRGPLVNYGLKMIAKGIGYKQPKQMSKGGDVSYLADGGDASGPMKPKGTDTQPAMLTPGEFVVNKGAAQDPENRKELELINSGKKEKKPEYHNPGGIVAGAAVAAVAATETAAVVGGAVAETATVAAAETAAAAAETTSAAASTAAAAAEATSSAIPAFEASIAPNASAASASPAASSSSAASSASKNATSASSAAPPNNPNPPSSSAASPDGGGGGGNIGNILKKIDFESFGKKIKELSGKFPGVGIASTALGVALNSVVQSVKIANQALAVFGPMVAKANPALMQKLEIVMNDLSGVIGRALIPAVEYLSPLLRKYADYVDYSMKKLTPSINKSAVAFDNLVSPLLDFGAVLYSVIGPVLDKFAVIMVNITNVIKPMIEFMTALASAIVRTVGILASPVVYVAMEALSAAFNLLTLVIKTTLGIIQTLLGAFVNIVGLIVQGLGKVISYIPLMGDVGEQIIKGGQDISKSGESLKKGKPAEEDKIKKGSSTGAAVREVTSNSISGVGDEIRKNALMAASGTKTQEEMLGDIAGKLDKKNLADAVAEGMQKVMQNRPQNAPPVVLEGKIPGALNKQEKLELGV